jgi:hypothetical protein
MYYTYAHIRLDTNAIFYIGKGKGKRLHTTSGHNRHWTRVVKKHGYKAIKLCDWDAEADALQHVICMIKYLRNKGLNLVNVTSGGGGVSGLPCSEETKLKISASLIGRPLSEEHKLKISIASAKYRHSEETKLKISAAHTGKKRSAEHNLNNSIARKGKAMSEETKLKIRIANQGHTHSDETKLKMSIAVKLRWASSKLKLVS